MATSIPTSLPGLSKYQGRAHHSGSFPLNADHKCHDFRGGKKTAGFVRQQHRQLKKYHLLMGEPGTESARINSRPCGNIFTSPLADC